MKVSKKFLTAVVLLAGTSLAHADAKLVPSDDSELSKLCIAAVEADSREAIFALTAAAGISRIDVPNLRCNGLPITRFALKYGGAKPASLAVATTSGGYLLSKSDSSPLTELCAAAAMSDAEYARVKDEHFSDDPAIDAELHCNGLPLASFVRKYRSSTTALVSSR